MTHLWDQIRPRVIEIVTFGADHAMLLDERGEPVAEGPRDQAVAWADYLGFELEW